MKYINALASKYHKEKMIKESIKGELLEETDPESKSIAVMLDLENTSNDIDIEGASIFVRELDTLRRKFGAKYCYICVSTHTASKEAVRRVLDYIKPYTNKSIIIGRAFLYGCSYDYDKDELIKEVSFFNYKKIDTFKNYYLNNFNFNNLWFAIIDDSLNSDAYLRFKDIHPCLFIKPGSNEESNFMNLSTSTKGFDGVIEQLDVYIRSIKKDNLSSILNHQKSLMTHLSSNDLIDKVKVRDYKFLIKYFEGGFQNQKDYYDVLDWLVLTERIIDSSKYGDLLKLLELLKLGIKEESNISKILELESYCEKKKAIC